MLVVAKQDNVDDLFAVWDTVYDRFLCVNTSYDECIQKIMERKNCTYENAKSRVDNPQPFDDIASHIRIGFEPDIDEVLVKFDELKHFLEVEIEKAEERKTETSNVYDGVVVGFSAFPHLQESHIRFCKHILKLIEVEV